MSEEVFSEGYLLKQAGSKAGKDLIKGALFEKIANTKVVHDQYGVLNLGAELLSPLHNPKDLQAAVNSVEYLLDSGRQDDYTPGTSGKTIVTFVLRCPENVLYGNKTALQNWPRFFEDLLGFERHIAKMGPKDIAPGKDWFANFRDVLNFEHSNKTFDYFEVAVPLEGLMEKLSIDAELYETVVKQAEDSEAREQGYSLSPNRKPHSLWGMIKLEDKSVEAATEQEPAKEEKRKGLFGRLFGG
jgi:hypothetical protein